jgi:hypothetical protein
MEQPPPSEIIVFPAFWKLSAEEREEAYALARACSTPEGRQKFRSELDEGVPLAEVLAELEQAQKEYDKGQS